MTATFARPPGSATLMHVAIMCRDVDESLRFYRDGLGFSRTYEWTKTFTATGQVVYCGRGVYIELEGHTYIELFPGGQDEVDSSSGPLQHIALIVPDVDEAYRKCLDSGGSAFPFDDWTGQPTTVLINGEPEMEVRVAFVKGPAGELIELYEQYSPVVAR
jgi:catechol 2,3-dioxygenase-like lactoylglutathione lyase family enzyme